MTGAPDPQFWQEVEEAFNAVLEAGSAARTAALETHCRGRETLRAEVLALLAAHESAGDFITPRTAGLDDAVAPAGTGADAWLGTRVGAFQLTARIGEGGMGAVYRAERVEGDFRQEVAVKLIAAYLYGADTLRRFVSERQILASLQHPNLVALLDGGVTHGGHPYIAMEYVKGVVLTEYCRRHALSLESRLRLFRQLCLAVAAAHRHLVVHRDLKPANVLVTEDGTIKVLDFGVAKLLEPQNRAAEATRGLVGPVTPDYASPEQLQGAPVTTACDVYALGVMLYELLAGRRPYTTAGQSMDALMQTVLVTEPPRPSTAPRGELPYDPARLRGDLDAIVQQAMAKDPKRRYGSVEELASELERFLEGRPVVARAPSLRYVVGKAVGRHRTAVAVAAVLVTLLIAALAGALGQAHVAARERERAERRFLETQQLAHSVIFKIHEAIVGLPGSTRARQLLVDEARAYLQKLAEDPRADVELRIKLAEAYRELGTVQGYPGLANLGDTAGAIASYERGIHLLEPVVEGPDAPLAVLYEDSTLWARLSHTLASVPSRRAEAEPAARRSLQHARRLADREPGTDRTQRALAEANVMLAYSVAPAEVATYWKAALDQHTALMAKDPTDPERMVMVALMETNLATHFEAQLDHDTALPHHRHARELYDAILAANGRTRHGDEGRAVILGNSGVAATHLGAVDAARPALEEALAIRLRMVNADAANANAWPKVAQGHAELARACEVGRDDFAALAHAQDALAAFARHPPEPKLMGLLVETQTRAGRLNLRQGRRLEGCAVLAEAIAAFDALAAANNRLTPLQQKQRDEAEALRRTCPRPAGSS